MVTMRDIRAVGRRIARRFRPERIILFGSHARGTATDDSDVDLLVIMPFEGDSLWKSGEVLAAANPDFAADVIVRTPQAVQRRLEMGDRFMQDILTKGKVLYEAHRG